MNRTGLIPKRFEIIVFSFLLSMFMTFIVSGISTLRTLGLSDIFASAWVFNFISSWPVAFPAVLIVAPIVRKLVSRLIKSDAESENAG